LNNSVVLFLTLLFSLNCFCSSLDKLVAHRGATNFAPKNHLEKYPENTLHSLINAYDKGVDYVECDVHFTKDNKIIVLHDNTIRKTCRSSPGLSKEEFESIQDINVKNLSFENQLSKVDVGFETMPCKIPLLEDFLRELQTRPTKKLIVEVKSKDQLIVKQLRKLMDKCVYEYKLNLDQVVFLSFHWDTAKSLCEALPEFCHLVGKDMDDVDPMLDSFIERSFAHGFDGVSLEYLPYTITKELIEKVHRKNLICHVWNRYKDECVKVTKELLDLGVDLVNTNQPEIFLEKKIVNL